MMAEILAICRRRMAHGRPSSQAPAKPNNRHSAEDTSAHHGGWKLDSLSLLLTSNDVRFSTDIAKATRASPKLLTRLCQPSKPPQFRLKIVAFTLPFKWSKALRVVLETSVSNGRQNGSKSSLSTPQHDLTIGRQQRGALGPHQQTLEAGERTILPWLSRQRY
jgi:hypothetical protein